MRHDTERPLVLSCEASCVGVGVVLSREKKDEQKF